VVVTEARGAVMLRGLPRGDPEFTNMLPGVAVSDAVWLERYDAYCDDRRGALALPVLRVRYLSSPRTWRSVDPGLGAIVRKEERLTRVNR
jgi:hypothetical protein